MIRGLFLGFIRLHLVHHAAHEPIYGLDMIGELAHHVYGGSPGDGYLRQQTRVVEGTTANLLGVMLVIVGLGLATGLL